LSRLPLDALKVDRSFITNMAEDPQQMSIVTAIISLAHAIDLKVIAEGVETATQAQLLRLLRCDQIQGYLIARPQPASDVTSLLGRKFDIPKS
jgi:EAL domain-containing protein (putative c-di-GMP-specific phosphodiesterase class I)